MELAPALSAVLVGYNTVLNTRDTDGAYYVPLNLAVATACVAAAARDGVRPEDLGLDADGRGIRLALGMAGAAAALLAAASLHPRGRDILTDDRAAGLGGTDLAYRTLVRIPIGTALVEEILFRGVLEALWRRRLGPVRGTITSNLVFGLWHIGPGLQALRMNRIRGRARIGGMAAMVAGTAAGGIFLSALRWRTRGIAAPVTLHATVNSMTMLTAVLANRRAEGSGTSVPSIRGRA